MDKYRDTLKRRAKEINEGATVSPEEEAFLWLVAPHFGLTDSWGGMETRRRVEEGSIGSDALAILNEVAPYDAPAMA